MSKYSSFMANISILKGRATNEGLTNTVLKWTFAQNKNKTYSSVLH